MSTYRPRRSRIYGANYDLSEQYYKKTLADLDDKYKPQRLSTVQPSRRTPKSDIWKSTINEKDDLSNYFSHKSLKPNTIWDAEDNIDDEIKQLREVTFRKRFSPGRIDFHNDINESYDNLKRIDTSIFNNDTQDHHASAFRQVKIKSEKVIQDDVCASEASSRAKATKDRLADLESEMLDIKEKQNERAKRNNHLKKLLAGNDDIWIE